jgi:hypothetical protein
MLKTNVPLKPSISLDAEALMSTSEMGLGKGGVMKAFPLKRMFLKSLFH